MEIKPIRPVRRFIPYLGRAFEHKRVPYIYIRPFNRRTDKAVEYKPFYLFSLHLFHIFCNFLCSVIFSGEHPAWDLVSFVLRLFWLFGVVHNVSQIQQSMGIIHVSK